MISGCVQRVFFPRVNQATIRVLAAEGCDVQVPDGQGCCGALSMHAGREHEAKSLARALIDAFDRRPVDFIVVNAAGCGSHLKSYGALLADEPAWADRARAFAAQGARRQRAARGDAATGDAPPAARARGLSRRLPPGARAGDPRAASRAAAQHPRPHADRDPRRGSVLRQRRNLQPDRAGSLRRDRRAQGGQRDVDRRAGCWPPPTPAARCRSRSCCARAAWPCRPRTRSRSSTPPSAACRFSAWAAESESFPGRRRPAGAR